MKSAELDQRLRHFAHQLRTGRLSGVALVRDKLKVVPLQAATPPDAEVLDRRLDALLPRVRITELLFEVAERTGFLAAFRDVRSGKEHDKPHAILAAILADGTNLGVERMANASQGATYAQLAWTQNWYISPENYEAALAQIVREHHRLPFARNWGEGVSASSGWSVLPHRPNSVRRSRDQRQIRSQAWHQDLLAPVRPFRFVQFAHHVCHRK